MRYVGITRCSKCRRLFEYFCLPFSRKHDNSDADGSNTVTLSGTQMCFEGVDTDGIPFYTAYCPYCKAVHELPKSDAKLIPKVYFEQ